MYLSIAAAPMPKRRVTIFTSSGCETSLGIGVGSFRFGFVAVTCQDFGDMIGCHIIVEVVIHLNGGRPAAGPDTFHFFKREDSVWSDALVADAQLVLEAFVHIIGSAQHAADVGAHLHVESAGAFE